MHGACLLSATVIDLQKRTIILQIEPSDADSSFASSGSTLWKDEVAERLAAHRLRGGRRAPISNLQNPLFTPVVEDQNRAARIAAAIADRYARQPSYREVLAAE